MITRLLTRSIFIESRLVWRGMAVFSWAILLALSAGCGGGTPAGKGKAKRVLEPETVKTAQSEAAVTRPAIRVTGTLYAMEDVVISAKVAGRIIGLAHDLGDRVDPGTTMAQIDRTDYRLAVEERRSAIRATLAKLGLGQFPSEELVTDEVPSVRRTVVQLNNVQARYERLKKLFDQTPPLISEQEYADAETVYKVARSAFEVEKANAEALLAEAQTLQAELNVAIQRLADTEILAPKEPELPDLNALLSSSSSSARKPGTGPGEVAAVALFTEPHNPELRYAVAERLVSLGEYVREGTPLFRLIDDDPVKLRAMVPERYVGMVMQDLSVTVFVQAHKEGFTGKITRISPQVDPVNRTFVVEVLIVNPDGRLKPGTFASASIGLPTELPAVRVPAAALTSFAGIHKVFTIKDGKAVENRVTLGDREGGYVLLTAGLEPGQQIVLSPPAQMVGGTPLILEE